MISALISALGNAFEVILSKRVLDHYKMPARAFFTLGSTLIFFVMCTLLFVTKGVSIGTLSIYHYLLFGGVIIVGFFYNYLYYYALKRGALCDVEPLAMMYPLVTMLIAIVFYPDERNLYIVIPALVAATTLIASRIRPHHLKMKKATTAMLGFVILIAIEANLLKPLLEVVSPMLLYTARIGTLATLFLFVSKPSLEKVKEEAIWQTAIVSLVVAVELSAYYYAIKTLGVVETSLILLLAPVAILFSSKYLFKEKLTLKKSLSSAVILACIAVAILIS